MFKKLQDKWGVNPLTLVLVLCVFAIGGSLSGYFAKLAMNMLPVSNRAAWLVIYIIIVTLLWPVMVLLVSIFFGQFGFFKNYLRKMAARMRIVRQLPD